MNKEEYKQKMDELTRKLNEDEIDIEKFVRDEKKLDLEYRKDNYDVLKCDNLISFYKFLSYIYSLIRELYGEEKITFDQYTKLIEVLEKEEFLKERKEGYIVGEHKLDIKNFYYELIYHIQMFLEIEDKNEWWRQQREYYQAGWDLSELDHSIILSIIREVF